MRTKTHHKAENTGDGEAKLEVESEPSPSNSKKPIAKTKKKKNKRKKMDADELEENKNISKTIQQRFGKSKHVQELAVMKHTKAGAVKMVNPDAHENIIDRAEELKSNKMYQVELRSEALLTAWKCALCHQRTCRDDLGDLFGPYYVEVEEKNWPEFIAKKPQKLMKGGSVLIDVWMHGDCALWAPGVYMAANQLENLKEKLQTFWGQTCSACHQSGASIPLDGKHIHYPCALKQPEVIMDSSTLLCKSAAR